MARRRRGLGSAPQTHTAQLNRAFEGMKRAMVRLEDAESEGDCRAVIDEAFEVAENWGRVVAHQRSGAGKREIEHKADQIVDDALAVARRCIR
jgi:hypothetical protein